MTRAERRVQKTRARRTQFPWKGIKIRNNPNPGEQDVHGKNRRTGTHNVHRHDASSDIQPPQTGPSAGPRILVGRPVRNPHTIVRDDNQGTYTPSMIIPWAFGRDCRSQMSATTPPTTAMLADPPTPAKNRQTDSCVAWYYIVSVN